MITHVSIVKSNGFKNVLFLQSYEAIFKKKRKIYVAKTIYVEKNIIH